VHKINSNCFSSAIIITIVLLVILTFSLTLASCGGGEGRLKARSLEYYNYLTGANELTSDEFDSPARRNSLTPEAREGMKRVAEELKHAREEIKKQSKVEPVKIDIKLITVQVQGRFGITVISARIPVEAVRVQVRWVRDRGRWYLYTATEAEVDAYGKFPTDLSFVYEPVNKSAS